jgi:hypothetical protein
LGGLKSWRGISLPLLVTFELEAAEPPPLTPGAEPVAHARPAEPQPNAPDVAALRVPADRPSTMWQIILGCKHDRPYVCRAWLVDAQLQTVAFFGVLFGVLQIGPVDGT